jgi:hypothetical protein
MSEADAIKAVRQEGTRLYLFPGRPRKEEIA